jgi:hypothetical protein
MCAEGHVCRYVGLYINCDAIATAIIAEMLSSHTHQRRGVKERAGERGRGRER